MSLVPCGEITGGKRKEAEYLFSHPFTKRRPPSAKCLFTLTLHRWMQWLCRTELYNAAAITADTSSSSIDSFPLSLFHTHLWTEERVWHVCLRVKDCVSGVRYKQITANVLSEMKEEGSRQLQKLFMDCAENNSVQCFNTAFCDLGRWSNVTSSCLVEIIHLWRDVSRLIPNQAMSSSWWIHCLFEPLNMTSDTGQQGHETSCERGQHGKTKAAE